MAGTAVVVVGTVAAVGAAVAGMAVVGTVDTTVVAGTGMRGIIDGTAAGAGGEAVGTRGG